MAKGRRGSKLARWVMAASFGVCAYLVFVYATLPSAEPLLKENPTTSALIRERAREAEEEGRSFHPVMRWTNLSQIPKVAQDAVLLSEDAAFYEHGGVDLHELFHAVEDAARRGHLGRGASTITQQLAKNLWLSGERSLLRKLKEVVLARRLEHTLSKKRILTLYLNVIEWGDGVFGIDAGARAHFHKSVAEVDAAEAAMLASMLPSPRRWTPERRSPALRTRALRLIDRMEETQRLSHEAAEAARGEIRSRLDEGQEEPAEE